MLAVHARSLGRALAGAPWAQQAGGLAGVLAERGLARDPVYTAAFPSSSGSSNRAAHSSRRPEVHSTTVLCVRKDGQASAVRMVENGGDRQRASFSAGGFGHCAAARPPPPTAAAADDRGVAAGGASGGWAGDHGRNRGQAQRAQDAKDWGARDRRVCRWVGVWAGRREHRPAHHGCMAARHSAACRCTSMPSTLAACEGCRAMCAVARWRLRD